jgi:hypothetical protein
MRRRPPASEVTAAAGGWQQQAGHASVHVSCSLAWPLRTSVQRSLAAQGAAVAGARWFGPGKGNKGGLRVCLPSRGGGAFGPQSRTWASPKLLAGRRGSGRQSGVGALCRPAGARSIIDDAIVRANVPFRRAVLIGSEGCTASAFETCYGY